ncbi:MAG: hypothetical protein HY078_15620 [Elusimicrobia bacterium]|nr:hypothetical protein [Elusimicrobiota bacterium]
MPGPGGSKRENALAVAAVAAVSVLLVAGGWLLSSLKRQEPNSAGEGFAPRPPASAPAPRIASRSSSLPPERKDGLSFLRHEQDPAASTDAKRSVEEKDSAKAQEARGQLEAKSRPDSWRSQAGASAKSHGGADGAAPKASGQSLGATLNPLALSNANTGWKTAGVTTSAGQRKSGTASDAGGPKDGLAEFKPKPGAAAFPETLTSSGMKEIIDAIKRHHPKEMSQPPPPVDDGRRRSATEAAKRIAGSDPRMQSAVEEWLIRGHAIAAQGVQDPYVKGYFQFVDRQTAPGAPPGQHLPNMVVARDEAVPGGVVLGWWDGDRVGITLAGLSQDASGRLLTVTHEMLHVYDTGNRYPSVTDGNPIGVNKYGGDGSSLTAETLAYSEMHCIFGVCK